METPMMKNTRRKLKKVMKKSRPNLSVSTNNIYQKKLKSAINVSLNSTRTVRTLQSNNRSLATSLEKMRQDFRQVHDHYALLLEENHELREKILELQRINVSEKYIDQEVDKRVEERMEHMKRKLVLLTNIATKFLDTLAELSDICVSSKSSMLEDLSSTESANQNYSLLPNLPHIASDVSLGSLSDFESAQSGNSAETEMEYSDFERNIMFRRNQAHEMTAIMEQSMLCPPTDLSAVSSKLGGGLFQANSYLDKKLTTKLPVRVTKHSNQTEIQSNDQGRKAIGELNNRRSLGSPKRVTRRQTFVVPNALTDDSLITDIATPPFLVTDCPSANGDLDINVQVEVRTPTTPAGIEVLNEKSLPKGSTSLKRNSSRQSRILTPRGMEQSPNKASPLQQQIPSPKGTKQPSKQRGSRSRKRQMSPKNSPVSHKDKQMTKKMGTSDQKSTTVAKKKNALSPPKMVSPKPEEKQQNFFISNEFNLINVHKGKVEKSSKVNIRSVIQHESPSHEIGEHTIFPVDDMEFTRMEESILAPVPVSQLACDRGDTKCAELVPHLPVTYSRSRSKQSELAVGDVDGSVEEKIPDAVTMRCTKPGQMMFAAARKESDGTRKNVPLVSRVRSKSKKQIAEMIESMADTQPETIFDFHDKTPVFLNSEKPKATSVFNFSADQSKLSPLTPLSKNRSRSRKSISSLNDVSSKNTSQSHNLNSGKNNMHDCILIEVSVPLKDDSPPANSTYRTRSRSVGRQQHDAENGDVEVKHRSPSRKRQARSKARSLANVKKSSSSVANSEVISTNGSPATKDQCRKSKSNVEFASDDVKDEASHLTSDALSKQKEVDEGLQVNKKDTVGNRTSKSRNTKMLPKKQVCDKEAEQNNENSSNLTTGALNKQNDDGEDLHMDKKEIVGNKTSKSCNAKVMPKKQVMDLEAEENNEISDNLTSDALSKQNDDGEDMHVDKKETVGNKTSKSRSTKMLPKKQVCDKEAEQNNENSSNLTSGALSKQNDDGEDMHMDKKEVVGNRTSKSRSTKMMPKKQVMDKEAEENNEISDNLTSDALNKQNDDGEDMHMDKKETVGNKTSKSRSTKMMPNKQIMDLEAEENNEILDNLTTGALNKQNDDGEDLHMDEQEIVGNRTSKSCNTKVLPKKQVMDKEAEQNNESKTHEDVNAIYASSSEGHTASVLQQATEKECMNITPSAESDRGDFCDTHTKTASESQSEMQDEEAVVSSKKTIKVTSHKTREKSLPKSAAKIDVNDSESDFSRHTNFINTRRDRTKGMKENKGYKNLEANHGEECEKSSINDLATIGDNAAQLVALADVSNAAKISLEVSEETGHLLEHLKSLRTPAFSHREDVQSAAASPVSAKNDAQKKNEQGLRVSRIVRGTPPGTSQSIPKRPAAAHSPESDVAGGTKRRRATANVNYAELKLSTKLRRGDPFTSHYCTGDKITIFKSPKGKKKMVKEGKLGSLHNQSISEELVPI